MDPIKEFLINSGYSLTDSGEYWKTKALYRGGDNPTSLSINKKTGHFTDFARNISGSFEDLVKIIIGGEVSDLKLKELLERVAAQEAPKEKIKVKQYHDPECLARLIPYWHFYTRIRGISEDVMRKYRVGLATTGKLAQYITTPIINRQGKIEGFFGRFHKELPPPTKPKTKNIGKKTDWVFPAFYNDAEIREKKEVILVEGLTDGYSFSTYEINNWICLFGVRISPAIINYICGINGAKIIIATNNDLLNEGHGAGNKAAQQIRSQLLKFIGEDRIEICLPQKYNDYNEEMRFNLEGFKKTWLTV